MSAPRNSRQVGNIREYTFRGQSVPSVTSILSAIDKPALRYWFASQTALAAAGYLDKKAWQNILEDATAAHEATKTHQARHQVTCDFIPDGLKWLAGAPTRIRDTAGERGTAVHEAAEGDANLDDVPENAKKAYGSYRQWVEDYQPLILAKEGQVFSDEGYAGSFDLIAAIGGKTYLIDLKTSKSVYHETRLQLAAYRNADLVMVGDDVDEDASDALGWVEGTAILHLTDDGYEFLEVESFRDEYAVFQAARIVLDFLRENDGKPVGRVIPRPAEAAA